MAPKSVCIIGAGPSGLVAAKTLLHQTSGSELGFSVTVFDTQPRIGGLWPVDKDDGAGLVHPLMVANQSRNTMQFSDLAWNDDAPQLPRAWHVGRYLQQYLSRYCAFEEERFRLRLGWRVEKTAQVHGDQGRRWKVTARSEDGVVDENEYDYLLIASGFFGAPAIPDVPGLKEMQGIPVVHSSRYRDLETLLPSRDGKGGKILVVGGQMSGVEIAGTIASQLSSAANAPIPNKLLGADKYTVHHIIQRPMWVFPLYTTPAAASTAAPFLPLDLSSYNLANRPHPLTNSQGHIPVDAARMVHGIYRNVLGTDQSEFSPLLVATEKDLDAPPYLTVNDWYLDFVRSGLIKLSQGKLNSVDGNTATITPTSEGAEAITVTDVAAIVLATGFEAAPSISFLPEEIQQIVSIDPSNLDNTILLAFHGTHHPKVPNLGFVGFYRSPYWGVMEMQARFLAELWTRQQQGQLSNSLQQALSTDTSIPRIAALRGDPRASQFPMGDYAFLMQEFANALDMGIFMTAGETPPLPHNGMPMDTLTPARYALMGLTAEQHKEVDKSLRQMHETTVAGLTRGKFVARAVFRSLLGEWQLERDLVSKLPSHPSGHWSGTAKFLLRQGTSDGLACVNSGGNDNNDSEEDGDPGLEYLYVEEGDFTATNGLSFRATRRYIWRYNEKSDKLSVWFVRTGDKYSRDDPKREEEQRRADYLFHELDFVVPQEHKNGIYDEKKGWRAKSGHLCIEDYYNVDYEFCFKAVNLKEWRLGYTVKGPQKDYTISGVYTRKTASS
ncbi:Flavin-containing monooxygenase FMO GS-OX-like 6 [Cytospora mali]|uniref:Flavin-containing monooxygenase FMO GS-OX-like 6 n=1 Tax=Cytospora mali TaxID=578113 RepID=A0A194V2H2_CYTMA|nr:Flavin-containing monooxygenase FMO GS-OX-like 6 [Valsa mali var. pyri (nom. inval.)]